MGKPPTTSNIPTGSRFDPDLDAALDEALDESFPASDPPSMTVPGGDADPTPEELDRQAREQR